MRFRSRAHTRDNPLEFQRATKPRVRTRLRSVPLTRNSAVQKRLCFNASQPDAVAVPFLPEQRREPLPGCESGLSEPMRAKRDGEISIATRAPQHDRPFSASASPQRSA